MLRGGNDHIAIVLYTSGSTGVPKGVRLPHESILNRLQWQWATFPYTSNEAVSVFKTALTFVDSIAELWGPLMCGLAILVVPKAVTKDPQRLVALLERYKIRRLVLVPTLLRSLLMYLKMEGGGAAQKLLYNLQIWVCSGEPLSVALASSFFDYFDEGVHRLYNFYGSTEVMGDVTFFACESKKQLSLYDNVPIGEVYPRFLSVTDITQESSPLRHSCVEYRHLSAGCRLSSCKERRDWRDLRFGTQLGRWLCQRSRSRALPGEPTSCGEE